MDKDDTLVEDLIDDDDDLLNISLDELNTNELQETISEEPDDDIIDLLDLLEKGDDDDLLGIDDDTDILAGVATSTEELSPSDLGLDDLLLDSEKPGLNKRQERATDDELDQLLAENSLDDLSIEAQETEIADNSLDDLLDATELEDLTVDTGFESGDEQDSSLQIEDILTESDEPDKTVLLDDEILDELAVGEDNDDLSGETDLDKIGEENILGSDDDILDELDDVLEKSIVSSDDESGEESLLESDLISETAGMEEQADTTDAGLDKLDEMPLDTKTLEEILSESNLLETAESISDSENTEELTLEEKLSESEETTADEESPDDLFVETDLQIETEDSILKSGESEDITSMEETAASDDSLGDIPVEVSPVGEELPDVTEETFRDETDIKLSAASDDSRAGEDISAVVPQAPLISEEKVEEIVREVVGEVVGEVVERIAREVFAEVAEKVITEAIDSLKKSLVPDSE